jgi:pimeloyl-ACP methyl ester carboxylesterase
MASYPVKTEFVEANGIVFETDQCGDGSRLALFLHGFPEHSFSWRHQLPLFAELGYRAWAPNMRGYGNSSSPLEARDYAIELLMEDVAGLMDASGSKEVVLIAHDWGAVIAWYFAMRRVRPLERLIIMNVPHPGVMAEKIASLPAQLLKSWYIFFFQLPWLPELMFTAREAKGVVDAFVKMAIDKSRFPEDVLDVYRKNALRTDGMKCMINYYRALVRGGGAERQRKLGFPVIDVPTLMIWGEEDAALDKRTTFGTENYVHDFTIRYLPNVSHWVQQEAPETVNAMIKAWLADEPVPEADRDGKTAERRG